MNNYYRQQSNLRNKVVDSWSQLLRQTLYKLNHLWPIG